MLSITCRSLFVALLCLLVGGASAAWARPKSAPSCLSAKAQKRLSACPAGLKKHLQGKKRRPAFQSAPPPRTRQRHEKHKAIAPPQDEPGIRDSRAAQSSYRLLLSSIGRLERLVARTHRKSPDRLQLLRRLAEEYAELRRHATSRHTAIEVKLQDRGKKASAQSVRKQRRAAKRYRRVARRARVGAVKYYRKIVDGYPGYSKLDEVLYYLAFEYEQAGKREAARRVYYELLRKAPTSKYVPNAYLAFGELFFQEAQADPGKWTLAAQAYEEAIKHPPPANRAYGYARYKLGYVHWNTGAFAKAMDQFKKVVEFGAQHPKMTGARQLAKAARRDLVAVYAQAGRPDRAWRFFAPLSGDASGETRRLVALLNDLGHGYLDIGKYAEGITLYRDLLRRDPGPRSCRYQTQISVAVSALKSGDKAAIIRQLDQQLATRRAFVAEKRPPRSALECSNRTAELVAETAMSWHLEAVGSGAVRGTGDRQTMDYASTLYDRITKQFSAKEFARFKFPRIVKDDWPNLYKIKYAKADLLYFQHRWKECGPAFSAVVDEDPRGPDSPEAAYAAAVCFQKAQASAEQRTTVDLERTVAPSGSSPEALAEKLRPKPLTREQRETIKAYDRYLCVVARPTGGEALDQYVEVKYARARAYFKAQHWDEAAVAFRDVALNHTDHEAGIFAAHLYLEALNVLRTHTRPQRTACLGDLGRDVRTLAKGYCSSGRGDRFADECALFTQIDCDVRRTRAEKLVRQADQRPSAEQRDLYRRAADIYLGLWREFGEERIAAGQEPSCQKMDEVLHNLARTYQAAHLLGKAIQVRQMLLDEKHDLHETEMAKRALYDLARNYQSIAVYDRAADYYERYAQATRFRGEHADVALSDAVVLRLGLGQDAAALRAARSFNRHLGARHPAQSAQIAFAVAAHHAERGDHAAVLKSLGRSRRLIDRSGDFDIQIQAHALLGRAYAKLGRGRQAAQEYRRVRRLWADPATAEARFESLESDRRVRQRRLGRALDAVGEALFFFAEQERARVARVQFPEYRGPGTRTAVSDHINTKVAAWIKAKRPLIEQATAAYRKIVDLRPTPPPRWVIAAGARVGAMWGTFVQEFRAAPIPDSIRNDAELRTAYYHEIDRASEPQKRVARTAFETCLGYSVTYQYFDEHSRSCEMWLADTYKAEYHLVDEFHGRPTRRNAARLEHAPALTIGGNAIRG